MQKHQNTAQVEFVRLGDYVRVKGRIGWKGLKKSEYTPDGPYMISGNNLLNRKIQWENCLHISKFRYEESPEIQLEVNDIIMTKDGTIGRLGLIEDLPGPATINSTIALIREISGHFLPEFLYYYFQGPHFQSIIKARTSGLAVPHIFQRDIKELEVPKLPKPEQRQIASMLSRVDDLIQKTDEIIEQTQRLKKGLMQRLLTEGIAHKEFRRTEIGNIPSEWKLEKLGSTLELCQYGLSIPMTEKGRYPIIRMNEISDGYIIPNIAKFVNIDNATFNKFKLEKGDVLVNRTNSYELVGRTGIFTLSGDYVFASYIIRLRPKREVVEPLFLSLYLIFATDRLRRIATRAVHQANINATNLKEFLIPIPGIEEQKKIVDIISSIENEGKLTQQYKRLLEKLKKGLLQKLLTGKIRVKV